MQSVGSARTIRLALLVSGLIACIPAQFGGVAKAEPITTVDIFSLPGMGSNNISAYGNTNVSILVSPAWAVPSSSVWMDFLYPDWLRYLRCGLRQMHSGCKQPAWNDCFRTCHGDFLPALHPNDRLQRVPGCLGRRYGCRLPGERKCQYGGRHQRDVADGGQPEPRSQLRQRTDRLLE